MHVPLFGLVAMWECYSEPPKEVFNLHCFNFECGMVRQIDKALASFRCIFDFLKGML
jgi:hypothetical protein